MPLDMLGRFERWLVSLIQLKVFWYEISRDSLRSPGKNLLYFVGYLADWPCILYYHDISHDINVYLTVLLS